MYRIAYHKPASLVANMATISKLYTKEPAKKLNELVDAGFTCWICEINGRNVTGKVFSPEARPPVAA